MQKKSKAFSILLIVLFSFTAFISGCNSESPSPSTVNVATATLSCEDISQIEPVVSTSQKYQLIYILVEGGPNYKNSALLSIDLIRKIIKEVIQPGDTLFASWIEPNLYKDSIFLQIEPPSIPVPNVLQTPTPYKDYSLLVTAQKKGTPTPIPTKQAKLERIKDEQDAARAAFEAGAEATKVIQRRNCQLSSYQESVQATSTQYAKSIEYSAQSIISSSEAQLIQITPGNQTEGSHFIEALLMSVKAINNTCQTDSERECEPKLLIFSDFDDYKITNADTVDLKGIDIYQIIWKCPFPTIDNSFCARNARTWRDFLTNGHGNVTLINGDAEQIKLIEKLKVRK